MLSELRLVLNGLRQKFTLLRQPEALRSLQEKRLRKLVAYAKQFSPYYAERLKNIDPARFRLEELPTLTKPVMMENYDRFLTEPGITKAGVEAFMSDPSRLGHWYLGKYAVSHTSGTGGLQAIIVQDRGMLELLFALQMIRGSPFALTFRRFFQRLFRRTRLAVVTIGAGFYPSASALAYAPRASKMFLNRMWVNQIEPLSGLVEKLNAFQPEIILAYANVLELLGREALAARLQVGKKYPLLQIINMSEPLSAGARLLIEKAFGFSVTDNYAMGECMALTTGCLQGRGMHVQADWVILEVVDRNYRPVPDGQPGEKILITNLYNTIQPFIRYEVNDVVTLSAEACSCGSPLPLIKSVEGRTDEVVWIQEGEGYRSVHPYLLLDPLDEYPDVGWYQIVQVERNGFQLRAASAPGKKLEAASLKRVMQARLARCHLDQLIQFEVIIDEQIAPDPKTGKLRRIVSKVGRPE